jgi:cytochrome c oxidase assembly factor CtaG
MLLHGELPLARAGAFAVVGGLATVAGVYARGVRRYRRCMPRRVSSSRLAAFLAGLGCVWVALESPIDAAAEARLSAHMLQHILLLTAAPALLLLGNPFLPLVRGLPGSLRRAIIRPLARQHRLRGALHALTHPVVALLVSSAIFWGWHVPAPFQLALRVPVVHIVEHASFFAGGLLFWWPVIQPWPSRPRWPAGAMIPYLLVADVQNTVLAAVLTFADRVLYPFYAFHAPLRPGTDATALGDQVLAGVLMWVPMSLAYLVPAALLTFRLLSPQASGLRVTDRDRRTSADPDVPVALAP